MAGLKVKTAPTATLISTADVKAHLSVHSSFTDDDSLIDDLRDAAIDVVRGFLSNPILDTVYEYTLDGWPKNRIIVLPRGPVSETTKPSIEYWADGGSAYTAWPEASNYNIDARSEPARIRIYNGVSLPSLDIDQLNNVRVTFTAGHGTLAADVPAAIKLAILQLVEQYYTRRSSIAELRTMPMPFGVECLLARYARPMVNRTI